MSMPAASSRRAPALVTLHVWGVATSSIPAAVARVAADRFALRRYPGLTFAKLLGVGSGQTFAPQDADPHHWALLTCWDAPHAAATLESSRVVRRWDAASTERLTITMTPLSSIGHWSGQQPFGTTPPSRDSADAPGPIASITRARIKWGQLRDFWRTVPDVVSALPTHPGLLWSAGIGEAPIGLQGTFSLWQDAGALNAFAFGTSGHRQAIARTRDTGWFAEELFARFRVVEVEGTFAGEAVTLP